MKCWDVGFCEDSPRAGFYITRTHRVNDWKQSWTCILMNEFVFSASDWRKALLMTRRKIEAVLPSLENWRYLPKTQSKLRIKQGLGSKCHSDSSRRRSVDLFGLDYLDDSTRNIGISLLHLKISREHRLQTKGWIERRTWRIDGFIRPRLRSVLLIP